jgi:hypothetical protein
LFRLPDEKWMVRFMSLTELCEAYDAAFIIPFASHRWESDRARSHWVELEGWQNSMAGPLSSIANTGGCEYVYAREDWAFAGVGDPAALRVRLLEWHAGLFAGVEQFVPVTPAEAADLAFMRSVAAKMRELIERACEFEQARWSAGA